MGEWRLPERISYSPHRPLPRHRNGEAQTSVDLIKLFPRIALAQATVTDSIVSPCWTESTMVCPSVTLPKTVWTPSSHEVAMCVM